MASTSRLLPSITRTIQPSFRPSIRSLTLQLPRQSPLPSLYHRSFTSTPYRFEATPSSTGTPIGRIDRRLKIFFTCTASVPVDPQNAHPGADAKPCGHRSSHEFSKRSYEKGVVIVQCPECENRHLIADHLQWFSQTPSPDHPKGQPIGKETSRTIEDIMREKGEEVRWIDEGDEGATLEVPGPEEGEVAKK